MEMQETQPEMNQHAMAMVQPDGGETQAMKKDEPILAVEVMNGIVFAVVLILFGLVWGSFASVTFASGV